MSNEFELKPCPWCGPSGMLKVSEQEDIGDGAYYVGCLDCGLALWPCESKEEAIEKWNSRQQAADAERYRWLKKHKLEWHVEGQRHVLYVNDDLTEFHGESKYRPTIDTAIDAAMKQEGNSE